MNPPVTERPPPREPEPDARDGSAEGPLASDLIESLLIEARQIGGNVAVIARSAIDRARLLRAPAVLVAAHGPLDRRLARAIIGRLGLARHGDDRRAGIERVPAHRPVDARRAMVPSQAARREAARQHRAVTAPGPPARVGAAQEFDEHAVVHALQAGLRDVARRHDREPASLQRLEDELRARGRFETRHQRAAVEFDAAVVAGVQRGMDDSHGLGLPSKLRMDAVAQLTVLLGVEGRRPAPVVGPGLRRRVRRRLVVIARDHVRMQRRILVAENRVVDPQRVRRDEDGVAEPLAAITRKSGFGFHHALATRENGSS